MFHQIGNVRRVERFDQRPNAGLVFSLQRLNDGALDLGRQPIGLLRPVVSLFSQILRGHDGPFSGVNPDLRGGVDRLRLKVVRPRRLELPRGLPHSDLNAARLPFRHGRTITHGTCHSHLGGIPNQKMSRKGALIKDLPDFADK